MTVEIREYLDAGDRSPFGRWFDRLNSRTAAKVTIALDKIGRGLMSNVKSVGSGVYERKIDFGPGYRVYFGTESDGEMTKIVLLLHGGTKTGQSRDIALARAYWKDYKARKRRGGV